MVLQLRKRLRKLIKKKKQATQINFINTMPDARHTYTSYQKCISNTLTYHLIPTLYSSLFIHNSSLSHAVCCYFLPLFLLVCTHHPSLTHYTLSLLFSSYHFPMLLRFHFVLSGEMSLWYLTATTHHSVTHTRTHLPPPSPLICFHFLFAAIAVDV